MTFKKIQLEVMIVRFNQVANSTLEFKSNWSPPATVDCIFMTHEVVESPSSLSLTLLRLSSYSLHLLLLVCLFCLY